MLLDQKEVLALLRCPRSGSELDKLDDQNAKVASSKGDIHYEVVNGYPILLCTERCKGLGWQLSSHTSAVPRKTYSGAMKVMKRLVSPPSGATKKNIDTLISTLFEVRRKPRVLIVGGGTIGEGMDRFYEDANIELVSFDVYASPNVQFVADAHCIPLGDNSFDAVIIQAVLEHVMDPGMVVSEIHRVLKPNGLVYAETPFLQQVHEGPYDFMRYTESGHRLLFRQFSLVKSGVCSGAGTQLLWALEGFFSGLFRSHWAGKAIKLSLFWVMLFDRLIPEKYNVDAANGVFFLGAKTECSISNAEIVAHYKGAQ
ncbi:class I SAM-dependent methyltransferase [Grimontia kaedaensis]|uniref:Class I SAM-dependent methyltransferase n=1 Tax=Grimontia kaedaensis TaxID=2872157 RepID=A0ABY4X1R0_9GAMM|nr:class I SAM-dependent methyltransferase [Grimontia kaedaensis]USH05140.1 class I SAM-dependent methyltransferase [Grimontia kaedaensis]